MNATPHLVRLYLRTSKRYKKVFCRLNRETISAYQRSALLREIRKLLKRLRDLKFQLRIAAATGAVVLALNLNAAQAQTSPLGPFVLQDRSINPLREPIFTYRPVLTTVDYDNDGDYDVVAGEKYYDYYRPGGRLRYFENRSSEGKPLFVELQGTDNPFDTLRAQTYGVAPAFADIDNDGDMDLFLGQSESWVTYSDVYSRGVEYYRNDGGGKFTKQSGAWNPATKEGNPLNGVKLGYDVSPVFVDFDKDGDVDLIAGSYVEGGIAPNYDSWYIHYYQNDGSGNFAPSATSLILDTDPTYYSGDALYPAVADVDKDGDYDLVIGDYYGGYLRYYAQETPGNFIEHTSEWDPVAKTGNPFWTFSVGRDASPVFLDFNKDGEPDLFLGDYPGYYKYSDNIINYYQNTGDGVFEEKDEFENPFDGVFVKQDAAPVLFDIDGDNDLDGLIGNKYQNSYYDYSTMQYVYVYSSLANYQNTNGVFKKIEGDTNPVDTLQVYGNFVPQFADVDGDKDLDLVSGGYNGNVVLFRNEDGVYKEDTSENNPFNGLAFPYNGAVRLVDLDNDKDLDLFMSSYNGIQYVRNDGSSTAPSYSVIADEENPIDTARSWTWNTPFMNFTDLDHDGDADLTFSGSSPYNVEEQTMLFFENTGTPENPVFQTIDVDIFKDIKDGGRIDLVDYDSDGDLDAFVGLDNGTVNYLENQNERVNTMVTGTVAEYDSDSAAVVIEPDLSLVDPDDDVIVRAVVSIQDFQPGETLAFTEQPGIIGVFNASNGILTFSGKASVGDYEALLRTVTFEVLASAGGRHRTPGKTLIDKTISFSVYDADYTSPQVASKSLQIFINDPPAVNPLTVNFTVGASRTVDLKTLVSDPNGAGDLDMNSLKVTQAPASGAATAINGAGILTIDYAGSDFMGTETLTVEVCDVRGVCAQNALTLVVTNTPPEITPEPVSTPAGSSKSINLLSITTDIDGNLDPTSFTITKAPTSKAAATIQQVSASEVNLLLDYEGITFHGTDEVTIRACDKAGACTESILSVDVDVDASVTVYNAVAPNSLFDNGFMRITGLPEGNKVSIFNRWGDKVFETKNYGKDLSGNTFKGLNDNGNALASGTYFYVIEIPGEKDITGYLTLKQ